MEAVPGSRVGKLLVFLVSGLQSYLRAFAYSSASEADLFAHLTDAAHQGEQGKKEGYGTKLVGEKS